MQRRINLAGAQNTWTVERLLSAKILLAIAVLLLGFFSHCQVDRCDRALSQ